MCGQPEHTHFRSSVHVLSDARTAVEIADMNNPHMVDAIRKPTEIEPSGCLLHGDNLFQNLKIAQHLLIDASRDFIRLVVRERAFEAVVAFRLSRIDPSAEASAAAEHINHDAVENMFSRMHGRFISLCHPNPPLLYLIPHPSAGQPLFTQEKYDFMPAFHLFPV